jgi:hypothetical protein
MALPVLVSWPQQTPVTFTQMNPSALQSASLVHERQLPPLVQTTFPSSTRVKQKHSLLVPGQNTVSEQVDELVQTGAEQALLRQTLPLGQPQLVPQGVSPLRQEAAGPRQVLVNGFAQAIPAWQQAPPQRV